MCAAAAARAPVRLVDGRTGRLLMWPAGRDARRSQGAKARVLLPSGAVLFIPTTDVLEVEW
jgi:hypothetical protein